MAVSGHHLRMAALCWHIVEVRFSWLCLELCELLLGTAHLHTCTAPFLRRPDLHCAATCHCPGWLKRCATISLSRHILLQNLPQAQDALHRGLVSRADTCIPAQMLCSSRLALTVLMSTLRRQLMQTELPQCAAESQPRTLCSGAWSAECSRQSSCCPRPLPWLAGLLAAAGQL